MRLSSNRGFTLTEAMVGLVIFGIIMAASYPNLARSNRNHRLMKMKTPTLVIHGGSDPLIPIHVGMESARLIPGAQLEVVEKMGHWIPRPVWGDLSRVMETFWDGVR